ncbi:UTRA domain-containing protein [Promicromonospora sp. NPDC050262]|uniref:UTRA domain-containing protein n=1 Tax=Promicromonospora sp. NPDC050262 TaxID=3155036 RepID=UPI0033C73CD8
MYAHRFGISSDLRCRPAGRPIDHARRRTRAARRGARHGPHGGCLPVAAWPGHACPGSIGRAERSCAVQDPRRTGQRVHGLNQVVGGDGQVISACHWEPPARGRRARPRAAGKSRPVPVRIGITFIPWSIAEGTALAKAENLGKRALYGHLEDLGYTIASIREEITARPATREEAEGLELPTGVPMIDLWHTGMTADKQPFEVTNFCMRADYSALDYDMPVDY